MAPNHLLDVPVIVKPALDKDETSTVNDFELDLRAPALPAETFFQLTGLPSDSVSVQAKEDMEALCTERIAQCYRELQSFLTQGIIEQAVAIASFSLFDKLEHINRLLGVDPQREQHIYALWRQTLESLRLRPEKMRII